MADGVVPVIDISPWFTADASARKALAKEVGQACEKIGFLVITGHNVPKDLVKDAWNACHDFFDMDLSDKKDVVEAPDYPYGYSASERLVAAFDGKTCETDSEAESAKTGLPDLKEMFSICVNSDKKRWPRKPSGFPERLSAYYRTLEKLAAELMKMFALALDLPIDFFDKSIEGHLSALRVINYPSFAGVTAAPGQLRASAHSDYGSLTILAIEDTPGAGGLQVINKDGSWQDVKPPKEHPDAFVVNLGDLMARWTNDKWRSTIHRVVNPKLDAGERVEESRRVSMAFFHNPNPDALIECLPSCVGEGAKYPPILAGDHLFGKHKRAQLTDKTDK